MATPARLIRQKIAQPAGPWTEEALMRLSENGQRVELVDGEPQMIQR